MSTLDEINNPETAAGGNAYLSTQASFDGLNFNTTGVRARWGEGLYRKMLAERHRQIAEAAYFKAEHRGFTPAHELDDWLEAQSEIDEASRPLPSY